jgi:signal transduction histidine kinase
VVANAALRRAGPVVLLGLALLFGALSTGYAWIVARHLRDDARHTSRMLGLVFAGLNDPDPDAAAGALLALASQVRALGVPIAVTDTVGRVTAMDNSPLPPGADSAAVARWIAGLDEVNAPILQPGVGIIHYGAPPMAGRLTALAVIQGAILLSLVVIAAWAVRWWIAAARDRLWVAMARESAHQLGTPLMSLTGWIDYLREHPDGGVGADELVRHLEADAERLERVARRFERIGRPARREAVGLGAVAERVVEYFRPRLPTLASPVQLTLYAAGPGPDARGDPVLIEWALEAVVKNAIDALKGRGGRVHVRVEPAGARARISVQDDGPGIAPEVRARLFEPGVTTKAGGWGIGLALARRIVEDQHDGRLRHEGGSGGTTFVLEFPLARTSGGYPRISGEHPSPFPLPPSPT